MIPSRFFASLAVSVISGCSVCHAQWLGKATAGIPRLANGDPNLSAPAPRTTDGKLDLSGLWQMNPGVYGVNATTDLNAEDISKAALDMYRARGKDLGKNNPSTYGCLPPGPQYRFAAPLGKWIQSPSLVVMFFEDLTYRQIFLDGRELEKDPQPSFMGYSVGRWDGDTLVIASSGLKDTTWLDNGGHPHSEKLSIVERIHRRDFGHLDIQVTLDDPEYYRKPWSISVAATLVPDTELLEFVCSENEKDREHHVGTASDSVEDSIRVAVETLETYAGTYAGGVPGAPGVEMVVNVTVNNGELYIDNAGRGRVKASAKADNLFTFIGGNFRFSSDQTGRITGIIFESVEGDFPLTRSRR